MATHNNIATLNAAIERLEKIDNTGLLRTTLGDESLQKELTPRLKKLSQIMNRIKNNSLEVGDEVINQVVPKFNAIKQLFDAQSTRQSHEYIQQKQSFLNTLDNYLDQLLSLVTHFSVAALEKTGLLDGQGLEELHRKVTKEMKSEAETALKKIGDESERILEAVKAKAKEIEAGARRTAAGISVKEAQSQFKRAQRGLRIEIGVWTVLSVGFVCFFFERTYNFMSNQNLSDLWSWQILYYTAIRITLLSGLAGLSGFCLKMLKKSIHLAQRNKHRQHVANSIESFVESAFTDVTRDAIFAMLVRSVIAYDYDEDIQGEEVIQVARMPSVDSVAKAATSLTVKSNGR